MTVLAVILMQRGICAISLCELHIVDLEPFLRKITLIDTSKMKREYIRTLHKGVTYTTFKINNQMSQTKKKEFSPEKSGLNTLLLHLLPYPHNLKGKLKISPIQLLRFTTNGLLMMVWMEATQINNCSSSNINHYHKKIPIFTLQGTFS